MTDSDNATDGAGNSNPGLAVVRGFYDAVAAEDLDAVLDLLDPQVEWRAPESLPWGGTFHGHEGVRDFFAKVVDQPAEFGREVQGYLPAGDRVAVLLRLFGRRKVGDGEFNVLEIHVWTIRDGRLVDFDGTFDTATVLRALELEPRG
jgi:ketosteroid isomerase-like protein